MNNLLAVPLIFALSTGQLQTATKVTGTWASDFHGLNHSKYVFEVSGENIFFSNTTYPNRKEKLVIKSVEGDTITVDHQGERLMYIRKIIVGGKDTIKIHIEDNQGGSRVVKFKKAEQAHRSNRLKGGGSLPTFALKTRARQIQPYF